MSEKVEKEEEAQVPASCQERERYHGSPGEGVSRRGSPEARYTERSRRMRTRALPVTLWTLKLGAARLRSEWLVTKWRQSIDLSSKKFVREGKEKNRIISCCKEQG